MIDAVGNPQSLLLLGGTSEIGLAVATRFAAARPLRVILAGRPGARLTEAAQRLRDVGCTVTELPFDARRPETHEEVVAKAFADGDVDVTVVAFGVLGDQEAAWTDVAVARELAEVNYVGAVTVGVALAERLRHQGHGALVAISSVAAERPRRSNFVYGSTKAGLDSFYTGLTEALRGTGVRVTVVRPGFVRTRMTEGLRAAPLSQTPAQVGDVIVAAVRQRREQVWAPAPLRWVMSVLRHLPRAVFRRLPV
ncbi:MAG TPA: decaprenylphospho-beta-D-erythro-pentofuranosid-2-ulose 2-reductase [Pseudonocardiaceae bacterium]